MQFGGKQALYKVVFYDKAAEQAASSVIVDGPWVRMEVRAEQESAQALASAFRDGGFPVILGDLAARLSFRIPNVRDSNKSRWKVSLFWRKIVDCHPRKLVTRELKPSHPDFRFLNTMKTSASQVAVLLEQPNGREFLAAEIERMLETAQWKRRQIVRPLASVSRRARAWQLRTHFNTVREDVLGAVARVCEEP